MEKVQPIRTQKTTVGKLVKTFRQLVYLSSSVMTPNLYQLNYWNNAVGNIRVMMLYLLTAHKSCFRSVLSSECLWELVCYNAVYTFVSDFCGRKVNTFSQFNQIIFKRGEYFTLIQSLKSIIYDTFTRSEYSIIQFSFQKYGLLYFYLVALEFLAIFAQKFIMSYYGA